MATPEEKEQEYIEAKRKALIDSNRRKITYADAETAIIKQDKKLEAISLLFMLAKKYNITEEDLVVLIENIPYI